LYPNSGLLKICYAYAEPREIRLLAEPVFGGKVQLNISITTDEDERVLKCRG